MLKVAWLVGDVDYILPALALERILYVISERVSRFIHTLSFPSSES